jgi:hypothetical protein
MELFFLSSGLARVSLATCATWKGYELGHAPCLYLLITSGLAYLVDVSIDCRFQIVDVPM